MTTAGSRSARLGASTRVFIGTEGLERFSCFDYKAGSFADAVEQRLGPRRVDVVLDFVGASHWEANQRVLADRGRLVSLGLLGGSRVTLDLATLLRRRQRVLGMVMRSRSALDKIALSRRFIRRGLSWFDSGSLRPVVDRVFPFERVADAHAYMEQNTNVGKIVLQLR